MKKPKKTRKVWALCYGTGGLYDFAEQMRDLETACGLRADLMRWRKGACQGRHNETNPCRDIKSGHPCRRYRATLTLEERK